MNKNKWFLNGGRGSGRTLRLLCETYENKIAELEEKLANADYQLEGRDLEIKELKADNDARKFAMAMSEKVEKQLREENSELKEELKKWKDEWQEQVQKATDEGYARTLQTIQLSKAKELLKRAQSYTENLDDEADKLYDEIEQFLNSEGK